MEQKPTVGRIVHYTHPQDPFGAEPRAAIITQVDKSEDTICRLAVLDDRLSATGITFTDCKFAEFPTPGYWNWPPRV